MMQQFKKIKFLIWLLLLPIISEAQIAPEIAKKFPPNVIARIYEVTTRVKLSSQKQELLGRYFNAQDSLAKEAIVKGLPPSDINKYYTTRAENLKQILSPLELNDYITIKDATATKFAVAVKYREQLALDKLQIDSLFMQATFVRSNTRMSGSEIKKYEAEHLVRTLKADQYKSLLLIINREKATTYANDAWQQAKQLGFVTGIDSAKVISDIATYQGNKIITNEYTATTGKPNTTVIPKPFILKKLDVFNGNISEKLLSSLIKYRAELHLTTRQVDDIVSYALQLETWRASMLEKNAQANVDTKQNEVITVKRMLKTDELYTKFLTLKNLDQAKKYTMVDLVGLQKFGLLTHQDSIKTMSEILKYQTDILVAVERMGNSNTPGKVDSVKELYAANKPRILLKLAAYNNKLPLSQFADAIKYRTEISLEGSQFDQLLDKITQLELLKLDNKAHGLYKSTHTKEFESENIRKILNGKQYDYFLFYKTQPKVLGAVTKDWQKLKQNDLAKGIDSAKTSREIGTYEQKWLIANERYNNDKSQQNAFLKKNIEDNKPDILKILDTTIKSVKANNETKKSLTW